jgi:GTP-binding protein
MDLSIPEMEEEMRASLPADLPLVFISSITQQGIQELKDVLWKVLQEENKYLDVLPEDKEKPIRLFSSEDQLLD